jgi:hypothetical protein
MHIKKTLAACVALLLPGIAAAAEDSVTRYRLAPDPANSSSCSELDLALGLQHTVTVKDGDVEITSAGGIDGRMRELREDVYIVVFELSGQRLDVIADLASRPATLTVSDRLFGCKWRANPEP